MRKTVREKLQNAKSTTNEKNAATDSRMQEYKTDFQEGETHLTNISNQEKLTTVASAPLPRCSTACCISGQANGNTLYRGQRTFQDPTPTSRCYQRTR